MFTLLFLFFIKTKNIAKNVTDGFLNKNNQIKWGLIMKKEKQLLLGLIWLTDIMFWSLFNIGFISCISLTDILVIKEKYFTFCFIHTNI